MKLKLFKILTSLWLIYHLFAIFLFPNTQSLLSRKLDFLLLPYGNSLNMNTPWQFFSPFPGPKMYFEYITISEKNLKNGDKGYDVVESEKMYWPPKSQTDPDWDNWRRLIYSARFLAMEPERIEKVFVPWVCRKHPEAQQVAIEIFLAPVLPVEKAQNFTKVTELESPQSMGTYKYDCRGKEEVTTFDEQNPNLENPEEEISPVENNP